MTLPKAFLVDDLGLQLAELKARMAQTLRTIELHRKRIEALRKRVDRQGVKLREVRP